VSDLTAYDGTPHERGAVTRLTGFMRCIEGRKTDTRMGEHDPAITGDTSSLPPTRYSLGWFGREVASSRTLVTFILPNWSNAWLNFVLLKYCARAPVSSTLAINRQPVQDLWIVINNRQVLIRVCHGWTLINLTFLDGVVIVGISALFFVLYRVKTLCSIEMSDRQMASGSTFSQNSVSNLALIE